MIITHQFFKQVDSQDHTDSIGKKITPCTVPPCNVQLVKFIGHRIQKSNESTNHEGVCLEKLPFRVGERQHQRQTVDQVFQDV